MDDSYKKLMEQAVTGQSGTSLSELFFVSLVPFVAYCLYSLINITFNIGERNLFIQYILALILIIPTILSQTFTEYTFILLSSIIVLITLLIIFMHFIKGYSIIQFGSEEQTISLNELHKPYITAYRSILMLGTCIAILAVDFSIFPRRFVKCETFGVSLMDTGVGSFIFSFAISSKIKKEDTISYLKNRIYSSIPLLLLGFTRLFVNKLLNYQEHISEYGLHWNFFFTLAAINLMSCIIPLNHWCGFAGISIILGYQYGLSYLGWEDYILNAPRASLFSANREGIFSSIGYFALYLLAYQLKSLTINYTTSTYRDWWNKFFILLFLNGLLWALTLFLYDIITPSRRMCNLSYVIWMLSGNLTIILVFLFFSLLVNNQSTLFLDSISQHQLIVFFFANILTGITNLSIKTLFAPPITAIFILIVYSSIISVFAMFIQYKHLKFKIF